MTRDPWVGVIGPAGYGHITGAVAPSSHPFQVRRQAGTAWSGLNAYESVPRVGPA